LAFARKAAPRQGAAPAGGAWPPHAGRPGIRCPMYPAKPLSRRPADRRQPRTQRSFRQCAWGCRAGRGRDGEDYPQDRKPAATANLARPAGSRASGREKSCCAPGHLPQ